MPSPILGIPEVAPTQTDKTTTINDAIVALEGATQDQLALNLAGGSLTLSPTQFTRFAFFLISGQTAAQTLTVPLSKRMFGVRNAGAYTITVQGLTGSSVAVAAGAGAIIQNDGTNCTVFGSGGVGPAGAPGPPGAISTLILGAGVVGTGTTITASGQTLVADWQLGTVTALGPNMSLTTGTLESVDTNIWNAGTVTNLGAGLTLSAGTLAAPSGGGTVTQIATTGGIHGGIITTSGTLTVDWNSGTVTALGGSLALSSGTLSAAAARNHGQLLAQFVLGSIATNGPFNFVYKAPYGGTVTSLDSVSGTGTFTLAVAINGTAVTGLSAVAVGAAANTVATGADTFSAGDTITGTISAAAGAPTNAVLNVNVTWS
jgi:hypothetical protein